MSITGLGSYQPLPMAAYGATGAAPVGLSNPLAMPSSAVGVNELGRLSFTDRIRNAARAAMAALKGGTANEAELRQAILAMQGSTARLAPAAQAAVLKQGRPVGAQGHTRGIPAKGKAPVGGKRPMKAKTWKTLAHHGKPGLNRPATSVARPTGPAAAPAQTQTVVPQGAYTMPGGMVLPLGQNAAGLAGLQGLPPHIQQQLGMVPTMLQGLDGGAAAGNTGPQLNATNQSGLGQGADGATQSVTNRNTNDALSSNRGLGSPWGGAGWGGVHDAGWGVATPWIGYGSSMNG